ncbi:thiamine transporter 1-like [Rhopalosiphum padi]|uniref:thiamine transporter 1-like n=1 Tax=Rhopalosiphum padi TaxID=40932 RepID=UPI00298DE0E8|nr:thiamine transporter 1-like [Rhopalosiphum padi]XP_060835088.1 thiamine transporter 1-like [Rhopalosiphum padi]XP_060835089.1 thiamine transporter 1-like [Rhopalosiphum padi]
MVAIYLFLLELRPLEPFMTAYLIGPDANLSLNEVATTIEYLKTYASLLTSVLMFMTADYFLYKPNIIFLTVCPCVSYFLMTGAPSVTQLRVSAFGVGAIYSGDMIALCYLYAKIEDVEQYQMATGIVTAAIQLGKVVGDFSAQIIVSATGGIYTILPYCNIFSLLLAIIWACLFPSVEQKNDRLKSKEPCENSSLLKYGVDNERKNIEQKRNTIEIDKGYKTKIFVSKEIWMNFKSSYSNPIVLKKSLWYIVGMGAHILVLSNINVLYSYVIKIPGNHDVLSNGLAESMVTLSGAAGAYLIGKVHWDWARYGDMFTAFCSIVMGTLMMSCYFYHKLIFIYLAYILFGLICQMHFVVIYAEIAKQLKKQCYSLVIEFNFFGSLIVVTILTLILIQYNIMHITIPGRFLFIGGLFSMLGIIFLFICLYDIRKK